MMVTDTASGCSRDVLIASAMGVLNYLAGVLQELSETHNERHIFQVYVYHVKQLETFLWGCYGGALAILGGAMAPSSSPMEPPMNTVAKLRVATIRRSDSGWYSMTKQHN